MYGDTEAIRRLAQELRVQGDEIRGEAAALRAGAEAVPWSGLAADAMRCLNRSRTQALLRAAALHDDAATAIEDHADEVDRMKRLIAAIESKVLALVAAARERLAGLAGAILGGLGAITPDPLDQLLDRFVPPPPGHKDWLSIDLPGLGAPVVRPFGGDEAGPATVLDVTGGSHGIEATYVAMRALADSYDSAGSRLRAMASLGGRVLSDDDLVESALLSPLTFAHAETAVLTATAGTDGVLVESLGWEADAIAIRGCIAGLEAADEAVQGSFEVLDYAVARALGMGLVMGAPLIVAAAGSPLGVALGPRLPALADSLGDLATSNPEAVEHLANGGGGLLDGLAAGLPGVLALPVLTPTTQAGAGHLATLYGDDGRPVVTPVGVQMPGGRPTSVADLIAHLAELAELSPEPDSSLNGTVEVQTVTDADGGVRHIVYLPGTDDLTTLPWTQDDDVRDMATNTLLIAGQDSAYQQGILEVMHQAGVGPDEPVLIVGHSQGGMAAVAILAGDSGFHVTDVVTAGSPTAHVDGFPDGANVLSLEQHGDVVPLLDGEPNPGSAEQTTVLVDAGPTDGVTAHHDYDTYTAAAAAADDSAHPSVVTSIQTLHDHGFLGQEDEGGEVGSQILQITRSPR